MSESTCLHRDPDGKPVVETRFHVRYFETDAMGVVHHAVYFTWFEEGRSVFTRCVGYPYARMEAEGVALAVTEVAACYHHPAHYDDEVIVAACLKQFRSRGMTFTYEVRRAADGLLLVTGMSKHVSIGPDGTVKRIPEEIRAKMLGLEAGS